MEDLPPAEEAEEAPAAPVDPSLRVDGHLDYKPLFRIMAPHLYKTPGQMLRR
jgi:hypothetical protein